MKFFAQVFFLVIFLGFPSRYGFCDHPGPEEPFSDRAKQISVCLEQNAALKQKINLQSLDGADKDYHVRFLKKYFPNACMFNTAKNADIYIMHKENSEIDVHKVVVLSIFSTTKKCAEQIEHINKTDANWRRNGILGGKLAHVYILKRINNTVSFLVYPLHNKYSSDHESAISAGKYVVENCFNQ